ncbi:hypothetical protein MJH12_04200 [bacterium]|nr:hypothetical protein [bacterium]
MAHINEDQLQDLQKELQLISQLDKIKQKSLGIFYLKSKGFLHFHEKDNLRWADVRKGLNWGPAIDIPFNATEIQKRDFFNEVQLCYELTFEALFAKKKK